MKQALAVLVLVAGGQEPDSMTTAEFQRLHAELLRQEKWQSVPWRTELLEARAAAEKEGKPLFLWTMNGYPTGCV